MNQAVISNKSIQELPTTPDLYLVEGTNQTISRTVLILGAVLIVFQILDGILTGTGMHIHGTSFEGNAMLRIFMEYFGVVPALVVAKSIAIAAVALLVVLSKSVRWVPIALFGVNVIYFTAAILPWSFLLYPQFLG